MDEAYDSPDSDGHASIPSPTETSFNMSTLHNARNWPPSSPSPRPSADSSDDEDGPIVVYRPRRSRSGRPIFQKIPDPSPTPSAALDPDTIGSDSTHSTPRQHWKLNPQKMDPAESELASDNEQIGRGTGVLGNATKDLSYDGQNALGTESSADLPLRLPPSTPDPKSTPDPQTGLTKRIDVRKNRSSPLKGTWPLRADSPTKAMDQLLSRMDGSTNEGERGASAPIGQELPRASQTHDQSSSRTEGQPLSASSEGVAESGQRLERGKQMRAVSGMSTGSVMQNETFEEINPSSIVEMVSQSFEKAPEVSQAPSAAQEAASRSSPSRTLISSDGGPEDYPKALGDLSKSAIPQTPPNKHMPKRKYIPIRGGPNPNSSLNQLGPAERSPTTVAYPRSAPITPQKSTLKKSSGLEDSDKKETSASSGGSASELQSCSPSPGPRGSNLPTEDETSDENTQERRTGSTIDSTTPEFTFKGSNLRKLKNNRSARRASMNSPPSQSSLSTTATEFFRKGPPSPTETDPRLSQDLIGTHRPSSAPLQPTVPGNIFTDSEEPDGAVSLANSTTNTPSTQPRLPLMERTAESIVRDQSGSNPLGSQTVATEGRDVPQKLLSTTGRVEEIVDIASTNRPSQAKHDTTQAESSAFTQSSLGATTTERQVHASWQGTSSEPKGKTDEERTVAVSESKRNSGNGLWSGFSQDFQENRRRYEAGEDAIQEVDDDEMSTSQACPGTPGSLRLEDVEVRVQTPNSVRGEVSNYRQDASSRHHRIAEPTQADAGRETAFGAGNGVKNDVENNAVLRNEERHEQADHRGDLVQQRAPERQPSRRRRDGGDTSESRIQAHQHAQKVAELQARIGTLEKAARDQGEEKAAHEHTIRHLRAALDQKVDSTINEPLKNMVKDLERQLQEEKQARIAAVAATEEKYTVMLEEQEAEYNHLQAELDDYVNCMPVDHSTRTSRIFEEDEAEEWMEDNRELSQFFDETIDHIFTEIRGDPERSDSDEAAEEAEMSLRHMATDAGYEGLNKVSLAAFGIRQLREENNLLRGMYANSEERVKEVMQVHNDLLKEVESLRAKVRQLENQNKALKESVHEKDSATAALQTEVEERKLLLVEKMTALEEAVAENARLSGQDSLVSDLEAKLTAVQQSLCSCQQQLEQQKAQTAQTEAKFKEQVDGLGPLRSQLQTSKDQASSLQAEVDAYKQRTSELLMAVETADKAHKDKVMGLEQQIEDLAAVKETLTKERDSARASGTHFNDMSAKVRSLEEQISATTALIETLGSEKRTLETSCEKAETEAKQARSKFNVLLHETTEKEAIWNNVKGTLQSEVEQKSRELHHAIEPYCNALERIAVEIDEVAPEREGDGELHEKLADMLAYEDVAEVETVAGILVGVKSMDETIDCVEQRRKELEEKNQRLKAAIAKWNGEHQKEKGKVEGLKKENKELALRLKAEKKQSDEKIGQLILALRR